MEVTWDYHSQIHALYLIASTTQQRRLIEGILKNVHLLIIITNSRLSIKTTLYFFLKKLKLHWVHDLNMYIRHLQSLIIYGGHEWK